jgi:hypothetical protein
MQFDVSMLPTGVRAISTFEELAVWTTQALSVSNPKDSFVRTAGNNSERTVAFGDFPDNDGSIRLQLVCIPKLDQSKIGLSLPDWKKVSEISATPCGDQFKG